MIKRIFAVFLALLFFLCACGEQPNAPVVQEPQQLQEEQPQEQEPQAVTELPSEEPTLQEQPIAPPTEKVAQNTCTLSVRCDTIWENVERLDEALAPFLPKDGVIYPEQTVTFESGESVFDLLKRELTQQGIHFEFSHAPMYNSVYIEGIANLYEFDCGDLSGWMYTVNGATPNVGISACPITAGDTILIWYTCDLGEDLES